MYNVSVPWGVDTKGESGISRVAAGSSVVCAKSPLKLMGIFILISAGFGSGPHCRKSNGMKLSKSKVEGQ